MAADFFTPVQIADVDSITRQPITDERLAFLDWLEEEEAEVRLINLPFGRDNAKLYNLYQVLSGYPHAEGAISRTPASAYDYIRANPVTVIWYQQRPTNCVIQTSGDYKAGVAQLIEDGFSHIVYHRGRYYWTNQDETFRYVAPAYSDDYVSIYRLSDMLASCPDGDDP